MQNFAIDTIFALDVCSDNTYLVDRVKRLAILFPSQQLYLCCTPSPWLQELHILDTIKIILHEGNFSLGAQKNKAAMAGSAPYILLSDPDFFSFSSFYTDMARFIDICLSETIAPLFIFPAYYANQEWSEKIFAAGQDTYDQELLSFFLTSVPARMTDACSFIAPYSNVILLSRDIFDAVGGYNENFQGFGSEDFEFMLRSMIALDVQPISRECWLDLYPPASKYYFTPYKNFTGFRRLLELFTFSIESTGMRFVHLHHAKANNAWYAKSDKKRTLFHSQILPYIRDNTRILDYDWLPRRDKAICIITNTTTWRNFLPLRCRGYTTIRHKTNKITLDQCIALAERYQTKNFAFTEDDCIKYSKILSICRKKGLTILEVKAQELKKIHFHSIKINSKSYAASRTGIIPDKTAYGAIPWINHLFYRTKKRIQHIISIHCLK